jgi:hypothetical protein
MSEDDPAEPSDGGGGEKKPEEAKGAKKGGMFGRFKKSKGEVEEKKEDDKDDDDENDGGEYSDQDADLEEEPPSDDEDDISDDDDEPDVEVLNKTQQKDKMERQEAELIRRDEERQEEDNQKSLMAVEDDLSWEYAQNYNTYLSLIARYAQEKEDAEEQEARDRFQLKLARTEGFEYKNRKLLRYETWKESPAIHLNYKGHATAVHYCCISSDWHRILSCSSDKTVKLWDRISGENIKVNSHSIDMPPPLMIALFCRRTSAM